MKYLLSLLLLVSTAVCSQELHTYIVVNKDFKKPVMYADTINNTIASNTNFILFTADLDTVISSLQQILPYLETVGERGINFTEVPAGNTKIKITAIPVSNGDRYSVAAETNYKEGVSRILFGSTSMSNRYKAINIKRFINKLRPNTYKNYPFSYPVQ